MSNTSKAAVTATIIVGLGGTGKTTKACELSESFRSENIVWITERRFLQNPFVFSACTEKTELIIVDEVMKAEEVYLSCNFVTDGVIVNKRGLSSFRIYPNIILVCHSGISKDELPIGLSFTSHCDVIECESKPEMK